MSGIEPTPSWFQYRTLSSRLLVGGENNEIEKTIGVCGSFGAHYRTINGDNFGFALNVCLTPCTGGLKFPEYVKIPIIVIQRNVNFVGKLSSCAHFKDNFMLIKNLIGTVTLKLFVFVLKRGVG